MKKILTLLALAIFSVAFAADAPFGFKWGQTFPLSKCFKTEQVNNLTICKTSAIPQPSTKFDMYTVLLYQGKVEKIIALGVTNTANPYGNKTCSR